MKNRIKETYYNKEWTVTNIKNWLTTYCQNNRIPLKQIDIIKNTSAYGSKKTITVFSIGNEHEAIIVDDKAAGAPRLNTLEFVVGKKGSKPGALTGISKVTDSEGDERSLIKALDKVLNTSLQENLRKIIREEIKRENNWKNLSNDFKNSKNKLKELAIKYGYIK